MHNGSLMSTVDRSYNRMTSPKLGGAGWILICRQSAQSIGGTIAERSKVASLYLGSSWEFWIVLLALEEQHNISSGSREVHCDIKGSIFLFQKKSKRIGESSANKNIRHVSEQSNQD